MKKINKKGLTLIELLAVIAIIAILFVLLIPQINSAIEKARVAGVQTDLHSYEIGIKSYLMENGDEMPDVEGLNANLDNALKFEANAANSGALESAVEKSPWGTPYVFTVGKEAVYEADGITPALDGNGVAVERDFVKVSALSKANVEYAVKYVIVEGSAQAVYLPEK